MKHGCLLLCALFLAVTNACANWNDSSPTLQNSTECKCDWRFLKHYETKQCTPVFEEGCGCPLRFDCPHMLTAPKNVCQYKEKIYKIGEKIVTSRLCEKCSCRRSFLGGAQMSCRTVKCRSFFKQPLEKGCYEVYEADKCCSVDVKCSDPESASERNSTEPTCVHNGNAYHLGERIYPEEDPCMSCLCDGNWTGINTNSCQIQECLLEQKIKYFRRGCVPIYHENKCCPIDFYCGESGSGNVNDTLIPKSIGKCFFEGESYSIGEVLDVKHPTNCVTCTCRTPPDFTCIQISCTRPPNDDYENCRIIYHEGICCPTYECAEQPNSTQEVPSSPFVYMSSVLGEEHPVI